MKGGDREGEPVRRMLVTFFGSIQGTDQLLHLHQAKHSNDVVTSATPVIRETHPQSRRRRRYLKEVCSSMYRYKVEYASYLQLLGSQRATVRGRELKIVRSKTGNSTACRGVDILASLTNKPQLFNMCSLLALEARELFIFDHTFLYC